MAQGRKGDSPAVRDAKSSAFHAPDRRRRKKLAYRSAEDRAKMLSSLGCGDGLLPPDFLSDHKEFDEAISIWRELAPELERIGGLTKLDRYTLAIYCVHMADWIEATKDIKANGSWYYATTTTGETLERLRPSVKIREIAERHIGEISDRFGFNPTTRYKMLRDEAIVAGQGSLFANSSVPSGESEVAPEAPTGMLGRRSSVPPDHMN